MQVIQEGKHVTSMLLGFHQLNSKTIVVILLKHCGYLLRRVVVLMFCRIKYINLYDSGQIEGTAGFPFATSSMQLHFNHNYLKIQTLRTTEDWQSSLARWADRSTVGRIVLTLVCSMI